MFCADGGVIGFRCSDVCVCVEWEELFGHDNIEAWVTQFLFGSFFCRDEVQVLSLSAQLEGRVKIDEINKKNSCIFNSGCAKYTQKILSTSINSGWLFGLVRV